MSERKVGTVSKIKEALDKMTKLSTPNKKWEETDMGFHFAIVEATHSVIATHIMETPEVGLDTFFHFRQHFSKADEKEPMWRQHFEVYEDINQRDPVLARQKIIDHLDFIEEKSKTTWKETKSEQGGVISGLGGGKS